MQITVNTNKHTCCCGHVWNEAPRSVLRRNVGCALCKQSDPMATKLRVQASTAAKALCTYQPYVNYLKETYGSSITLAESDITTFTMGNKLLHACNKGHSWRIEPKLFKRYENGCPYCMTHTTRTAKLVLNNI